MFGPNIARSMDYTRFGYKEKHLEMASHHVELKHRKMTIHWGMRRVAMRSAG